MPPFLFSSLSSLEKPISPKAVKGFDVPQLTKNYYNVVSFLNRMASWVKAACL